MKNLSLATLLVISLVLFATFIDIANAYSSRPPSPEAPIYGAPLPSQEAPAYGAPPPSPEAPAYGAPPPSPKPGMPEFCPYKCVYRCSTNPRPLCKILCMRCCGVCKCVPVGPYGDKGQCPCYRDIKNKIGQSKCP